MSGMLSAAPLRTRSALAVALMASTMIAGAGVARAQEASQLSEVVVTAEKREENLQRVPISVQALSTKKLEQLQVANFDDYAKFLPSVSYRTFGPGFASVYMRGVASGENANHSGPLPSVGTYLDESPITTIGGALDIRIYDIARVEALAGPQGTLYGASSQSGTLRIITNKPDTTGFSAAYDLQANQVDHGGTGYSAQGYVNQPLSDKAAIRLVGWAEHDAGYIDNIPGTMTYPTSGITISNAAIAKNNYNDVDIYGGRAALKIDLDDNWTITPTFIAQDEKSNGIFAFDPGKGDLKVSHFYPEYAHDRWLQAAMTIEGQVSNLDVTYAGSYMRRRETVAQDYTDYSFFYDTLFGYGSYWTDDAGNPINPSQYIKGDDLFTKQSHEIRVSTPKDNRVRAVAGAFYQRQTHFIQQDYLINGLATALSVPGWPNTIWLTEQQRVDRDYAVFGEASWDITSKLTLTGGLRFFKSDNSLVGFFGYGAGYSGSTGEAACFAPTMVGTAPCTNLDKRVKENGHTYKVNLTYQIDDDRMVYATTSTGFRPGGINRKGTLPPYLSDYLTSYEAGWKTSWLDKRVRWNGDVFWEDWKDFQFSFLGANGLTEIKNAGQARIKGVETDLNWIPVDGLTLSGAAAYTDAKLSVNYCGTTDPSGNPITTCASPQAPKGTALPITPKFKANATARYEFPLADAIGHVQGALVYQSGSWADLRTAERAILGRQQSYTTVDFTAGVDKGNWSIDLSLLNAFDERADLYRYAECAASVCGGRVYLTPNKPRTLGVRFGQKF